VFEVIVSGALEPSALDGDGTVSHRGGAS
jgi:hypothetical protein